MTSNPGAGPDRRRVRRHPRLNLDERLVLTHEAGGRSVQLHGRCVSFSEGGFGAVLAGHLEAGEVVTAEFRFETGGETLRLRAQVRHRRGFHHGFEFLALSSAQIRAVRQALEALASARKG